jgi:hypothetical protein
LIAIISISRCANSSVSPTVIQKHAWLDERINPGRQYSLHLRLRRSGSNGVNSSNPVTREHVLVHETAINSIRITLYVLIDETACEFPLHAIQIGY